MKLKITKGSNVSTDTKNLVAKLTKQCLREMSKKKYEIIYRTYHNCPNVTYKQMLEDINIYVKKRGQRSNGGKYQITIDVSKYEKGNTTCYEYDAYKDDPTIGQFTADPETCLLGTVAHEVAHFIQYTYGPATRYLKNTYKKPHGEGFKYIYRQLRREIVNPRIAYIG
jgi:hypothetical protein